MLNLQSALVPLFLAVLGFGLLSCRGGAEEQRAELPELTPFDDELALQLAGIAVTASEVRGLELHDAIEQGTLTGDQLAEYYQQAAIEAQLQADINYGALNTTYRLLHMIGPDDDLLDLGADGATGILGFYAPAEDQLVLVSDSPDELSLDNEATLAHEYVHSFQDKAFDLAKLLDLVDKEGREKASTEYGDTLDALIEGDATVAHFQYVEQKVGPEGLREWLSSAGEPLEAEERGEQEPSVPPAFARYAAFPYTYGSTFVRYLYDDGGWETVNRAYEDPPQTEEQILHPEKYLSGETAIGISLRDLSEDLGEGWQQEMDVVFGEFDVYNWVRSTLDNEFQATSAATGWGGGRLAVYASELDPDRVLVHIALMWDDEQESREFYTAFGDVVRLIDPEPAVLDPSTQILAWEAEDEVGHAWLSRRLFQMIVGVDPDDLEVAKHAVEAPARIPESAYVMTKPANPATANRLIRGLQNVLPQAGDLPPGFVLVQSGDIGIQNPIISQNVEERFVFFTDARSPGDGVMALVSRARGALPAGISWAQLELEDPRLVFEDFLPLLGLGGDVAAFSALEVDGIGEGAVGARAELSYGDGPRERVQMIVFGRGAVLAVVAAFHDIDGDEIDILQLARVMDDRLARYRP